MNTTSLRSMSALLLLSVGLGFLLLAGCRVGPNYVRPQATAPPVYRGADEASVSSPDKNSLGDENWAKVFNEDCATLTIQLAHKIGHPTMSGLRFLSIRVFGSMLSLMEHGALHRVSNRTVDKRFSNRLGAGWGSRDESMLRLASQP
jgi:hypothetical protein